ncbi:uncharacterized protein LOC130756677 [Actinidia eriantha]|uniref:uncharacterized protein LOC130756677 n=1 Tax=Actinidia eriantha TaxID=165200 RepID=UPI002584C8B7|nr:uncharacterized protein LOC130756677 [Actinidia eriantha]
MGRATGSGGRFVNTKKLGGAAHNVTSDRVTGSGIGISANFSNSLGSFSVSSNPSGNAGQDIQTFSNCNVNADNYHLYQRGFHKPDTCTQSSCNIDDTFIFPSQTLAVSLEILTSILARIGVQGELQRRSQFSSLGQPSRLGQVGSDLYSIYMDSMSWCPSWCLNLLTLAYLTIVHSVL